MLASLRTWADRLISLSAALGSIGLIFVTLVILIDVIGRGIQNPLYGSQDLMTMTLVIVIFGGMAICDRQGSHVAVDLLENYFPDALNRAIDILSALLGALIFVALAYTVYESAKISTMLNLSTNLLRLPKAWFQWGLCSLSLLTAVAMLLRVVELSISGRDVRKEKQSD